MSARSLSFAASSTRSSPMCGAFDVACHVAAFFAPIIFWAKIVIYCVVGVLVAALLLWAYRKAGWWGVGIVLTLGLGAGVFKIKGF